MAAKIRIVRKDGSIVERATRSGETITVEPGDQIVISDGTFRGASVDGDTYRLLLTDGTELRLQNLLNVLRGPEPAKLTIGATKSISSLEDALSQIETAAGAGDRAGGARIPVNEFESSALTAEFGKKGRARQRPSVGSVS